MVSFQLLQGFGVGLLVIAFGFAAAAFGLLDATEKREVGAWPPGMVGLFLFAVVLLLIAGSTAAGPGRCVARRSPTITRCSVSWPGDAPGTARGIAALRAARPRRPRRSFRRRSRAP
jgi:hypothetical protein